MVKSIANKDCILTMFNYGRDAKFGNTDVIKFKLDKDGADYFKMDFFNIIYSHFVKGNWTSKKTKINVI